MSGEPKMFRIDPDNHMAEAIAETDFTSLGWKERRDIQEWIAVHPDILGGDLLIIGKEFSGFDLINERLDLLAVDGDGKLNQSQGGMCICRVLGIGAGVSRECFGP